MANEHDIDALRRRYEDFRAMDLRLDMTRGKPCAEQLDLANPMLDLVTSADYKAADGTDCRNYGGFEGLPEARRLFAEYMGVEADELLIGGNSSLMLMHDAVARCFLHGNSDSERAWRDEQRLRFVCPVPGYDRHFAICEAFGIEMVTVPMTDDGPDMDAVEALVAEDASVKGIWVVPKYANPTGQIVSAATGERLAKMKTAAPDFRIFWDNAYAEHHLTAARPAIPDILALCKEEGVANRALMFGSTSKISFAGAGLAFMAASVRNIEWMRAHGSRQTIGPDKLNQLRHVRFFRDLAGVHAHMERHAEILKPKFDAVLAILDEELGGTGLATWTKPVGGYFISVDTADGLASRAVELCGDAGVRMTEAGATFPYGKDPRDRNVRIAPSMPRVDDLRQATRIFATCVKLAAAEQAAAKKR